MSDTAEREVAVASAQKLGLFDADIHPVPKSGTEIRSYLAPDWHGHFDHYREFQRKPFANANSYPRAVRALSRRDSWPPGGGLPGSDLNFMREQHLDPYNIECGVLQVLDPVGNKLRHPGFAAAMCSAINDWQALAWAEPEPRLKGSIIVPQEDTSAAIREIERLGRSPLFRQIMISPRSEEPLGRPRYWPIYEAAEALGISVTLHVGGENGFPVTPAGHPSFFFEQRESHVPAAEAVLTSLILEGVIERFPRLRVITVEAGGIGWVPALSWRLDHCWERMGGEIPQVRKPPSSYLRSNFWFSSQPIDEPEKPEHLREVFDWVGWDRILFATDYPHWDFDDPKYAVKFAMTPAEQQMFFRDNARTAFGLQ
ncbi:amidohydrolase family protein [Ancylobacter mangrovi]|uniref:amidohydrolase family protein n=1 Tax=Ancylobacter mangrovi TaxID=2972472 RepID=UPI0021617F56|nr:amidohydrolase family protein [Ancylobacter mangrovi]MCS0502046.1 amidohydrolase [Ancylobacter mangrovi]